MRTITRILLVAVAGVMLFLFHCKDNSVKPTTEIRVQSPHFLIVTTTDKASRTEADEVLQHAESLFAPISKYVGPNHTPKKRFQIHLEGEYKDPGSYVDFDGIHLFRYPKNDGGYLAVLAHELVHAFGVNWFIEHEAWDWPTYRFFDEGFAEFLAQQVDSGKVGFPFYGFSEDVVVGHWLVAGEAIPFDVLRERHEELNQKCGLQAYTLRASWIRHLDETFGRDAVLMLVYPDQEPTDAVTQEALGLNLKDLDLLWDSWIRARYELYPEAEAIWRDYEARTPWYQVCEDNVDY